MTPAAQLLAIIGYLLVYGFLHVYKLSLPVFKTRKKIPKLFYLHQKRAKYTTLILLIRSQILSLLFIIFSILLLTRKQWLDEALLTVKK